MREQIDNLVTEQINENSLKIDNLGTLDVIKIINEEDKKVAYAVEKELPNIAKAVDIITEKLKNNAGRLVYIGAGTSGRLGVLDASECPPTFNTPKGMIYGLIAGGDFALRNAIEGSEDIEEGGREDLETIEFTEKDVLVGIAASGRTPYVIGALKYANSLGAKTVSISCNKDAVVSKHADVAIEAIVGPEVVTGSTRMKSGTAQKMILNMLTTGAMIKLGKTYKNYMIDVQATNEKLKIRSINILKQLTGTDEEIAKKVLVETNWNVKLSLVVIKGKVSIEEARNILEKSNGIVSKALQTIEG